MTGMHGLMRTGGCWNSFLFKANRISFESPPPRRRQANLANGDIGLARIDADELAADSLPHLLRRVTHGGR
jgi:hypothetical protein